MNNIIGEKSRIWTPRRERRSSNRTIENISLHWQEETSRQTIRNLRWRCVRHDRWNYSFPKESGEKRCNERNWSKDFEESVRADCSPFPRKRILNERTADDKSHGRSIDRAVLTVGRVFQCGFTNFDSSRMIGNVTILGRGNQKNIFEIFQSWFLTQFVQISLFRIDVIFEGHLS